MNSVFAGVYGAAVSFNDAKLPRRQGLVLLFCKIAWNCILETKRRTPRMLIAHINMSNTTAFAAADKEMLKEAATATKLARANVKEAPPPPDARLDEKREKRWWACGTACAGCEGCGD